MQKVSDIIANFLKEKEIKHVFGIVGAGNAHIFNSITELGYTQLICVHHEQAAVMAMIGYYRATGKISASIVTTGAGSTNAVTGVVSGWMDSVPGLIIAGNENSKFTTAENRLRIWGIQGYDGVAMVAKYTKLAIRVTDPTQIKKSLDLAYSKSLSKRFGPSWVEVPLDIQANKIDIASIAPIEAPANIKPDNISIQIEIIKDLIKSSKRPILWLGHGIRLAGAENLARQLVEKFKMPALVSWAGIDLLNNDDEFNFGSAGIYGLRSANFILQNCDLVITIGTRLSLMQVGYEITEFAREAKLVVNDIDPDEALKLGTRVTLPIICDAKLFIEELLQKIEVNSLSFQDWFTYCKDMRTKYPRVGFENQDRDGYINSHKCLDKLHKYLEPNQMITTDMGTALISAHQVLMPRDGQRLFTSTGLGEMGYGLPAAIGASLATNKSKVVCLNCDGGMMLNLQELQTMVHHKLPIKLFIFTNDGYLMIKHTQKALFKGVYSGTDEVSGVTCPDYSKIAKAFDLKYYAVNTWDDFDSQMAEIMGSSEACICEIFISPEQPLVPKLSLTIKTDGSLVSPPLEDLSPLIPLSELQENMLIGLHEKSLNLNRG